MQSLASFFRKSGPHASLDIVLFPNVDKVILTIRLPKEAEVCERLCSNREQDSLAQNWDLETADLTEISKRTKPKRINSKRKAEVLKVVLASSSRQRSRRCTKTGDSCPVLTPSEGKDSKSTNSKPIVAAINYTLVLCNQD